MNNKLRSYFPVLNSCAYFNTAYVGPMSIQLFEFRNKLEKEYLNDGDKFKIDNIERIDDFRETISGFINSKKGISLILIACLICMSVYSFSHWLIELFSHSSFGNIDSIFYHDFFELLILADVFILLLSFQYTERYTQILRNTGFVICTILIRLSFGTSGLTNVLLIISSVVFGLAILRIYNLSERSS